MDARWQVIKLSDDDYAAHGVLIQGPRCEDETLVPEAEVESLHQQLRGAVEDREAATALAERYGEAIVAISEALRGGYVTRARTIIASLDTGGQ